MQGPRGGGFPGKRNRQHGYDYNYPPSSSTWASEQQAVRFAPPPPPPPFLAKPPPPPPPPSFFAKPAPRARKPCRPAATRFPPVPPPPPPAEAAKCAAGTRLLAGYLAHEYLTYGTLLGEQVVPPPAPIQKEEAAAPAPATPPKASERYKEVSRLIMGGGARIPGIVNPSQLGGWLGIKK